MKLFTSSAAAVLLVVGASADQRIRSRHHSGGGQGKPGGKLSPDKLQSMLDSECPLIECNGDTSTTCTFEKPERPDLSGLDEDAILQLKAEFKAMKEDFKQKMLQCACCSDMSTEDIFDAMGMTGSSPFGGEGGSSRPSGGFGGKQGGKLSPDKLQTMIDTKCPTFECEGNTADALSCTFEKPERPYMTGLDEDALAELKTEFKAMKKDFKQKMVQCACCSDMSVEDILAAMGKGGTSGAQGGFEKFSLGDTNIISSTSGDGDSSNSLSTDSSSGDITESTEASEKEGGGELGAFNDADVSDSSGDDIDTSIMSGSSSVMFSGGGGTGRPGLLSGGRPQGNGKGGEGKDLQAMLAEKCQEIDDEKCAAMASQNIDCERFDSMMTANTRGKFKKILYCGCCRD